MKRKPIPTRMSAHQWQFAAPETPLRQTRALGTNPLAP